MLASYMSATGTDCIYFCSASHTVTVLLCVISYTIGKQ